MFPSFWIRSFSGHLFCTDDVLAQPSDALCMNIARQMPDNGFNRFARLGVKCKKTGDYSQELLYGFVVHHTFSCDQGSGSAELPAHNTS